VSPDGAGGVRRGPVLARRGPLKEIEQLDTKEVSNFLASSAARRQPPLKGAEASDRRRCFDRLSRNRQIARTCREAGRGESLGRRPQGGRGSDPCRPVCIVAEGTTFYHLKSFHQRIEYHLRRFLLEEKNVYHEIIQIENATLVGAAIAGLTKLEPLGGSRFIHVRED